MPQPNLSQGRRGSGEVALGLGLFYMMCALLHCVHKAKARAAFIVFACLIFSALMQLRKENQDAFTKRHGIKLGFMSAFVKASAYALTQQPTVNAVIEGQEIVYRDYVTYMNIVSFAKDLIVFTKTWSHVHYSCALLIIYPVSF